MIPTFALLVGHTERWRDIWCCN